MNNIVEINYPNLDSYFKNLVIIQEEFWRDYWPQSKVILMKNIGFLMICPFLLYLSEIFMQAKEENSLLYFVSQLCVSFCAIGFCVISVLTLSNLLQLLLDYTECKQYFESRLMRKQTEIHLKLLDDFPCYISTSHLEFNSKGIITGINKENSLLCQKLENSLQNKLKETS